MKNSLKNNIESNLYARYSQNTRNKLTSQSHTTFKSSRRFFSKSSLRLFLIKSRCYIYDEKDYKMQKYNVFKIIKKLIRTLKKKKSKKVFFIKSLKGNKRSQKTYEAKFDLFDIINNESFEKKEIVYIIKKVINKLQLFL